MSEVAAADEVRQLVLVPLMRNAWRLCDRTIASSDADNLVAYVELVDDAYDVVWMVAGPGVETFTALQEVLFAAIGRLSKPEARHRHLSLVPDAGEDLPAGHPH